MEAIRETQRLCMKADKKKNPERESIKKKDYKVDGPSRRRRYLLEKKIQ